MACLAVFQGARLTVYKRELYDCAECINLCLLLRDRFPELNATLEATVAGVLRDWIKEDGSFRSRRLMLGWTMFRCIAGRSLRCFEAWRFIFAKRLAARDRKARKREVFSSPD